MVGISNGLRLQYQFYHPRKANVEIDAQNESICIFYIDEIVRLHCMPVSIVSDQDLRFG